MNRQRHQTTEAEPVKSRGHNHERGGCGCQGGGRCADCPCRRHGETPGKLDIPSNT
ncbi:MAG: hypothetical protein ACOZHQ_06580 [Thermodesulfobacteriota bacterium]